MDGKHGWTRLSFHLLPFRCRHKPHPLLLSYAGNLRVCYSTMCLSSPHEHLEVFLPIRGHKDCRFLPANGSSDDGTHQWRQRWPWLTIRAIHYPSWLKCQLALGTQMKAWKFWRINQPWTVGRQPLAGPLVLLLILKKKLLDAPAGLKLMPIKLSLGHYL